ncbi:MAG TPA: hypothetical protein VLJ68_09570 [Chitinophagaceae bacterium]|nr:hypothetical protein [Chitinophagaceae bacterium]
MKPRHFFYLSIFTSFLFLASCGSKDKKNKENTGSTTTTTTTTGSKDGVVPVIDTANLKDEASILAALEKITDAWVADKKRPHDEPYTDHSFELVGIYSAITIAADRYATTLNLNDPDKALAFLLKTKVYRAKFNQE